MLATVGDLVDDVVVVLATAINVASDTEAVIERRRGGSAANVAATAARLTGSARFLGQVGDDSVGTTLLAELADEGVDVDAVRRRGRTGSIVVLVDAQGERSFLTDPGTSRALDDPQESWLDDIDVLHVPLYSLAGDVIADTAATLVRWAHWRSIAVSIDVSSVSVIEAIGAEQARERLVQLRPDVVFANADEAAVLGVDRALASSVTFVKRGRESASVFVPGAARVDVPATELGGTVDSTGAGDAFAAGVLSHRGWTVDPAAACAAGHAAAAAMLRTRLAVGRSR